MRSHSIQSIQVSTPGLDLGLCLNYQVDYGHHDLALCSPETTWITPARGARASREFYSGPGVRCSERIPVLPNTSYWLDLTLCLPHMYHRLSIYCYIKEDSIISIHRVDTTGHTSDIHIGYVPLIGDTIARYLSSSTLRRLISTPKTRITLT